MYRSSSSTRVSDDYFSHSTSSSASSDQNHEHEVMVDQLPTYNPQSHVAMKENNRLRSAEYAIHFIPLVLLLCAIILWFFSTPVIDDVVSKAGDSLVSSSTDNSIGNAKRSLLQLTNHRIHPIQQL